MYTTKNFKTKKSLKEAVAANLSGSGPAVTYYQPGLGETPQNGTIHCEGPHYPEPHKWYATCEAKDGKIVSVK
jgi:homoserine kinase